MKDLVSYSEFIKIEIRVGTIIFAVFIGPFVSLSLKLVAFLKK